MESTLEHHFHTTFVRGEIKSPASASAPQSRGAQDLTAAARSSVRCHFLQEHQALQHIGGGIPTAYPEITLQRYGALNVRATMQYVRDLIWAELDSGWGSTRPTRKAIAPIARR
ncbi:MAG: hypothetical protein ABI624_10025 [Casimicrobiaceae bacterium]